MIRILITGKSGYIAGRLYSFFSERGYTCEAVSVRETLPGFTGWDVVVHCAGTVGGLSARELMAINCDLTVRVAQKAKAEGVGHFVFMSSMAVYGAPDAFGGAINDQTAALPETDYGKSKLNAEQELFLLASDQFRVSILRPPMVYGKNCSGNYKRLLRLASWINIFPEVKNARSMLHIDNLSAFVLLLIENTYAGEPPYIIYRPQNREPVCTSDLVKRMAALLGRKIYFSRVLGFLMSRLPLRTMKKLFGSLHYDPAETDYFQNRYCVRSFEDSIEV